MFLLPVSEQQQREGRAQGLSDHDGADQSGSPEKVVQQEHQGDIKDQLADERMYHSAAAEAHALHAVGGIVIKELDQGSQAAYAQKEDGESEDRKSVV